MSERQKKSYWVGRDSARELARNQSLIVPKWHKLRIPTKPATHSNRKPATDSDLKPAGVPL